MDQSTRERSLNFMSKFFGRRNGCGTFGCFGARYPFLTDWIKYFRGFKINRDRSFGAFVKYFSEQVGQEGYNAAIG